MRKRNGKPTHRLRNGAQIAVAAAIMSGAACSGGSEKLGAEVSAEVQSAPEKQLEAAYGLTLEEMLSGGIDRNYDHTFSRENLGRSGDDPASEYTPDQIKEDINGPASIQVSFIGDEIRVKDVSRDGVDDETMQWILNRLAVRKELLLTANKSGVMDYFTVVLNATDVNYDDDPSLRVDVMNGISILEDNRASLIFPRAEITIAPEVFDQQLIHELTHVLAESISKDYLQNGEYAPEVGRMLDACVAIREKATEQFNLRYYRVVSNLERAATLETNPEVKRGIQAFLGKYKDGSYVDLLPTNDPKYVKEFSPQFGSEAVRCSQNSLLRQHRLLEIALGIVDDEGKPELERNPESLLFIGDANTELLDLLENSTILQYLVERQYDPGNDFGHGHTDLSGQIAAAITLLFNPELTGRKLASAPPGEEELIIELMDSVTALLEAKYPELAPLLDTCRADLDRALNFEPPKNLEVCQPALVRS